MENIKTFIKDFFTRKINHATNIRILSNVYRFLMITSIALGIATLILGTAIYWRNCFKVAKDSNEMEQIEYNVAVKTYNTEISEWNMAAKGNNAVKIKYLNKYSTETYTTNTRHSYYENYITPNEIVNKLNELKPTKPDSSKLNIHSPFSGESFTGYFKLVLAIIVVAVGAYITFWLSFIFIGGYANIVEKNEE